MDINKISNETIFRILFVVAVFIALMGILFQLTTTLIWIFCAFLLSVVMFPVINWFHKKMPNHGRGLAIAAVYVLIFIIVGLLLVSLVPLMITQSAEFFKSLPEHYQAFLNANPQAASYINKYVPSIGTKSQATDYVAAGFSFLISQTAKVFGSIAAAFTIFTVSIYMSLEGPAVLKKFYSVFESKKSERISNTVSRMYNIVIKYIVANLATAALAGIGGAIMLWIFHVPNILFLSILIAFLDLIPMIGVFIIGAILVGMGLIYGGFWPAVIMGVYSILYAQFEYSYLEPVIYGKATNISPLTIIIAVLIFGALAGILGLFIAVPVAACIQLLILDYLKYNKNLVIEL